MFPCGSDTKLCGKNVLEQQIYGLKTVKCDLLNRTLIENCKGPVCTAMLLIFVTKLDLHTYIHTYIYILQDFSAPSGHKIHYSRNLSAHSEIFGCFIPPTSSHIIQSLCRCLPLSDWVNRWVNFTNADSR